MTIRFLNTRTVDYAAILATRFPRLSDGRFLIAEAAPIRVIAHPENDPNGIICVRADVDGDVLLQNFIDAWSGTYPTAEEFLAAVVDYGAQGVKDSRVAMMLATEFPHRLHIFTICDEPSKVTATPQRSGSSVSVSGTHVRKSVDVADHDAESLCAIVRATAKAVAEQPDEPAWLRGQRTRKRGRNLHHQEEGTP